MANHQLLKNSITGAVISASIGLTACGGGDTPPPTTPTVSTVTLSGKVADGYLSAAKVCLDLNRNKLCETTEPSSTSTAGGNYSFDATQIELDSFPVVVEVIAGTTVDEDNPGATVTQKYTLTAPAGKGAFVSPLTTIIQGQIETTGASAESIEASLLASMGESGSGVSLFDDYIAEKADTTNGTAVQDSYEKLHQTAQVTAAIIAENIAVIESALTTADPTVDINEAVDAIVALIVERVVAELSAITTEIDVINADSAQTFDADTVVADTTTPIDTTTVVAEVEAQDTDLTTLYANSANWWGSMEWGTSNWSNQ